MLREHSNWQQLVPFCLLTFVPCEQGLKGSFKNDVSSWRAMTSQFPVSKELLTSDPLSARRDFYVKEFFHGQRVALLVAHHRAVIQPVEVRQRLQKIVQSAI